MTNSKNNQYWDLQRRWIAYQLPLGELDEAFKHEEQQIFVLDSNIFYASITYKKDKGIDPTDSLRNSKVWLKEANLHKKLYDSLASQNLLVACSLLNKPNLFFLPEHMQELKNAPWRIEKQNKKGLKGLEQFFQRISSAPSDNELLANEFKQLMRSDFDLQYVILGQLAKRLHPLRGTTIKLPENKNLTLTPPYDISASLQSIVDYRKSVDEITDKILSKKSAAQVKITMSGDATVLSEILEYNKKLAETGAKTRIILLTTDTHLFDVMADYPNHHDYLERANLGESSLSAADAYLRHPLSLLKSFAVNEVNEANEANEASYLALGIGETLVDLQSLLLDHQPTVATYQQVIKTSTGSYKATDDFTNITEKWYDLWEKVRKLSEIQLYNVTEANNNENTSLQSLIHRQLIEPTASFAQAISERDIKRFGKRQSPIQRDEGVIRGLPPVKFDEDMAARKVYVSLLKAQQNATALKDLLIELTESKKHDYITLYSTFLLLAAANCANSDMWYKAESYARLATWISPARTDVTPQGRSIDGREANFLLAIVQRLLIAKQGAFPTDNDKYVEQYSEGLNYLEESCFRSLLSKGVALPNSYHFTMEFDTSIAERLANEHDDLRYFSLYISYSIFNTYRNYYLTEKKRPKFLKALENISSQITPLFSDLEQSQFKKFQLCCDNNSNSYEYHIVVGDLWTNNNLCCIDLGLAGKAGKTDYSVIGKERLLKPISSNSSRSNYVKNVEVLTKSLAKLLDINEWGNIELKCSDLSKSTAWFEDEAHMLFPYDAARFTLYLELLKKTKEKLNI